MLRGPPLPRLRCETLVELVASAARSSHALTFVDAHEEESELSFAELAARAARAAGGIAALGVERGERVALVLPTGIDFMEAFFGTVLAGAIPVPQIGRASCRERV